MLSIPARGQVFWRSAEKPLSLPVEWEEEAAEKVQKSRSPKRKRGSGSASFWETLFGLSRLTTRTPTFLDVPLCSDKPKFFHLGHAWVDRMPHVPNGAGDGTLGVHSSGPEKNQKKRQSIPPPLEKWSFFLYVISEFLSEVVFTTFSQFAVHLQSTTFELVF